MTSTRRRARTRPPELIPAPAPDSDLTSDDWYSPPQIVDPARFVLGGIDFDPASCAVAQMAVRAERWCGLPLDGLAQPWAGRTWLNPPYSNPAAWVERLITEHQAGTVPAAMLLVPLAGSPAWASAAWAARTSACLFRYRLQFWHPARSPKGYDRDNVLFYFGPEPDLFRAVFANHGAIV